MATGGLQRPIHVERLEASLIKWRCETHEVVCGFFEHSDHLVGSINTSFCSIVIACSLHTMLSYHVHHFKVTGKNGLMVLEKLQIISALYHAKL